jgi:23S rRNA G2445 N2-methylase RlmL
LRFFATAAKGTEPALRDELRELKLFHVRADRGGVHFEGDLARAAYACIWSRIALRVLLEVAAFESPSGDALYEQVRKVDWNEWLTTRSTLAVRATCRSSSLTHSQFVAQKTKDAVVDALRDRFGTRPSVDREDPDVLISVHLLRDRATLYLDVGGASLHRRGWRAVGGEAPLRETLAAAILRLSGWDRDRPLVDPMCGSGTIAIEAAAWSRRIAPGLSRPFFGMERWASHGDALRAAMKTLREEATAAKLPSGPRILAADSDARAVRSAKANALSAGVDVAVEERPIGDLSPLEPPGFVVTNPPYGERLPADTSLYAQLGESLRRMRGHTLAVLAGAPAIGRAIGRDPDRWWLLFNGPIECRLLLFLPESHR